MRLVRRAEIEEVPDLRGGPRVRDEDRTLDQTLQFAHTAADDQDSPPWTQVPEDDAPENWRLVPDVIWGEPCTNESCPSRSWPGSSGVPGTQWVKQDDDSYKCTYCSTTTDSDPSVKSSSRVAWDAGDVKVNPDVTDNQPDEMQTTLQDKPQNVVDSVDITCPGCKQDTQAKLYTIDPEGGMHEYYCQNCGFVFGAPGLDSFIKPVGPATSSRFAQEEDQNWLSKCPNCGQYRLQTNPEGSQECLNCGHYEPETIPERESSSDQGSCPNCGSTNTETEEIDNPASATGVCYDCGWEGDMGSMTPLDTEDYNLGPFEPQDSDPVIPMGGPQAGELGA